MNVPFIPIRLHGGISVGFGIVTDVLVGTVFELLLAGSPKNQLSALLQTTLLGYKTKLALLMLISFVLGFGLTFIGNLLITTSLRAAQISKWSTEVFKRIYSPDPVSIRIITSAFGSVTNRMGLDFAVLEIHESQTQRNHAMVGTLLPHYTSLYKDLGEIYRLSIARLDVARGLCAACFCAAILPQQGFRVSLLICGVMFLIVGLVLGQRYIRLYGYLISIGHLRETDK